MIISVHQPQYIPWLGFFDKIAQSDHFVYLDTVQYKPREWQNRNKIRTKEGSIWLTIPVISKGKSRQSISDVEIDNSSHWASDHWKSLQLNYAKAPYFKKYAPFFEDLYSQKWNRLCELNIHIIQFLLETLGITTSIFRESDLGTTEKSTDRIIEICRALKADTYLTGIGGKNYLEEDKFEQNGMTLLYQEYTHPTYQQVFAQETTDFFPNLTILDLLFNEGENSLKILTNEMKYV